MAIGLGANTGADKSLALGQDSAVDATSTQAASFGFEATVGALSLSAMAIGTTSLVGDNSPGGLALGAAATVGSLGGAGGLYNTALGFNAHVGDSCNYCISIHGIIPDHTFRSFVVGGSLTGTLTEVVLIGANGTTPTTSAASYSVVIGSAAVAASTASHATVLGYGASSAAVNTLAAGTGAIIAAGAYNAVCLLAEIEQSSYYAVSIGAQGVVRDHSQNAIAISGVVAATSPESIAIGDASLADGNSATALGHNATAHASSMALGAGAISNAGQIVMGDCTSFYTLTTDFRVKTSIPGPTLSDLVRFDRSSIAANLTSAMYLLYKNSLGVTVSQPVTINPTTGALTVPLV